MTRDELREHLDRELTPRPPWLHPEADVVWWRNVERASSWRDWFDGGEYLGERSGRTGPDAVDAKQRCGCEQCGGRAT